MNSQENLIFEKYMNEIVSGLSLLTSERLNNYVW